MNLKIFLVDYACAVYTFTAYVKITLSAYLMLMWCLTYIVNKHLVRGRNKLQCCILKHEIQCSIYLV